MTKDILLDIDERDILFDDKSDKAEVRFNVRWEGNVCKILISQEYESFAKYDENGVFSALLKIQYKPLNSRFVLMPVIKMPVLERVAGISSGWVFSNINGETASHSINACQLPTIDIDGLFRAVFKKGSDKVLIYSSQKTDLLVGDADGQTAQLLSLCAPGKNYRYPTTGIDMTKYINAIIEHTDLKDTAKNQYEADGKSVKSTDFDAASGSLETIFNSNDNQDTNNNLAPVSELNIELLDKFSDNGIRTFLNIEKQDSFGYQRILNGIDGVKNILFFPQTNAEWQRLDASFTEVQNIQGLGSGKWYSTSAPIKAGTIIAFRLGSQNTFAQGNIFLGSLNVTSEYLTNYGVLSFNGKECCKCAVVQKSCTIKYLLSETEKNNGKGIFAIQESNLSNNSLVAIIHNRLMQKKMAIESTFSVISDETVNQSVEYFSTI